MKKDIPKTVRPSSPTPTAIEEPLSPTSSPHEEECILSPYPTEGLSMEFLIPDPLAPFADISSPPSSAFSDGGETCFVPTIPASSPRPNSPPPPSSTQGAPSDPVAIAYSNFADIAAPPVQLFHYRCQICNVIIVMPDRVAEHLVRHKHPETGDWVCTSCGKQYLRGRWGYGMLLMHLQGRGGSTCNELVDLRAQYGSVWSGAVVVDH